MTPGSPRTTASIAEPARLPRRSSRTQRTGQAGFALVAALGGLLLMTTIVVALLGLSYTATTYSGDQVERDVETRAADSALEAAVSVLRSPQGAALGQVSDPTGCRLFPDEGVPAAPGSTTTTTVPAPGVTTTTLPTLDVGETRVRVACQPLASDSPLVAPDGTESNEKVRLLGEDYGGAFRGSVNPASFDWAGALPGLTSAQRSTVSSAASSSSSLVHSGPSPLPFTSPVAVRSGAAGVVSDAAADGPAFTFGADYRQGALGALADLSAPPEAPLGDACGVLATRADLPRVEARAVPLRPACNDATTRGLSPTAPVAQVPARGVWRWTAVETTNPVTLPEQCSALPAPPSDAARATVDAYRQGDLVVLRPGAYTGESARRLNRWLSNDATCQNKVFWFNPQARSNDPRGVEKRGQFYFDVSETPTGASNALVINDPSSIVVFGTERWNLATQGVTSLAGVRSRWAEDGGQGLVCDTNQRGVRVELSSRTSIRHEAGLVAMCDESTGGEFGDQPSPVVYQGARRSQNWPTSGQNPPTSVTDVAYQPPRFLDGTFTTGGQPTLTMICNGNNFCASAGRGILGFFGSQPFDGTAGAFRAGSWSAPTAGRTDDEVLSLQVRLAGEYSRLATATKVEVQLRRGDGTCNIPVTGIGTSTFNSQTLPFFGEGTRLFQVDLTGQCRALFRDALDANQPITVGQVAQVQLDVRAALQPQCEGRPVDFIPIGNGFISNKCPNTKPFLRITTISLEAIGTDAGPLGSAFKVSVDPAANTDFVAWGQVSAPLADLDIDWRGSVPAHPLFNGSMWFNGIGSQVDADGETGVVCCVPGESSERRVRLHAFAGPDAGQYRLLATAQLTIQDWRPATAGETADAEVDGVRAVRAPGYRSRIEEWRLCANNRPAAYTSLPAVPASECLSP